MDAKMVGVNRATGRRMFTMMSKVVPSLREIGRAQAEAGYSPAGYGGPMSVRVGTPKDAEHEIKWECFSSCE